MDFSKIKEQFEGDLFAKKLGIEVLEIGLGYGKTRLTITEDMVNSVGVTHGGAVFAVADLAFAVASNSHGQTALGINMNISYTKATKPGAVLTAEAMEDNLTKKTGMYRIVVNDENNQLIAVAQGVVYRFPKAGA